jgi:hypothetical protein
MASTELLQGAAVFTYLCAHRDDAEATRSAYWDEQVPGFSLDYDRQLDGACAAGNVSRNTSFLHTAAHWVLQAPWRRFGARYGQFPDFQKLGRLIARRQERQFTEDMMRQVLTVALVGRYLNLADRSATSCVIGDGYGVLSALLVLAHRGRKVIMVNLRKPLSADVAFVERAVPNVGISLVRNDAEMAAALASDSIDVIAVQADDAAALAAASIGAVFNLVSMQEMTPDVISAYFRYLRAGPGRTAFYCCNRVHKVLPDGTVTEFDRYPWRDQDEILMDGICPWLSVFYSSSPPFWHKKPESSFCRHRLAYLAKDA